MKWTTVALNHKISAIRFYLSSGTTRFFTPAFSYLVRLIFFYEGCSVMILSTVWAELIFSCRILKLQLKRNWFWNSHLTWITLYRQANWSWQILFSHIHSHPRSSLTPASFSLKIISSVCCSPPSLSVPVEGADWNIACW
jgi:hypothetical protein